jgi:hypothetical protein
MVAPGPSCIKDEDVKIMIDVACKYSDQISPHLVIVMVVGKKMATRTLALSQHRRSKPIPHGIQTI